MVDLAITDRINKMSDLEFRMLYVSILQKLQVSRHSDPIVQVKAILLAGKDIFLEVLQQIEENR
jgi:hypothetical protein